MRAREESFTPLVQAISGMAGVVAVGKSGGNQMPQRAESDRLVKHHCDALTDREDIERAAARKDALFYHFKTLCEDISKIVPGGPQ